MMKIEVRGIIFVLFFLILARAATASPDDKHDISGVVLKVDHERHSLLVSCKSVPGYMDAMVMSFPVRDATVLDSLQPGEAIQFSFVVNGSTGYADNIRTRPFQSLELDPTQTRRLKILESVASEAQPPRRLPELRAQHRPMALRQRELRAQQRRPGEVIGRGDHGS